MWSGGLDCSDLLQLYSVHHLHSIQPLTDICPLLSFKHINLPGVTTPLPPEAATRWQGSYTCVLPAATEPALLCQTTSAVAPVAYRVSIVLLAVHPLSNMSAVGTMCSALEAQREMLLSV